MASDRDNFHITCPHCDHPIVSAPKGFRFAGALICPGCGAALDAPGPLDWLLFKLKKILAGIGWPPR